MGDLVEAGLPNITGGMSLRGLSYGNDGNSVGALYYQDKGAKNGALESADIGRSDIGIDASRSNPIYGKSTTVQPQAIKGYLYIVLATSVKTDVQVNIDNIATDLNGKAGTDLSNLNSVGKTKVANLVMPSGIYVDLTLPATGGVVTMPADGYLYLNRGATSGTKFIRMTANILNVAALSVAGISNASIFLPVKKGTTVEVSYSCDVPGKFRFIYAEGSQP